jgi:hypothetical protein
MVRKDSDAKCLVNFHGWEVIHPKRRRERIMMDVYATLMEKAGEVAESNKFLLQTVRVEAKIPSTQEAVGNPEEDDFPLQKGKERLMEARFHRARGQAFTDRFGNFDGRMEDVISIRPENNFRRAVFVATVNAMMRRLDLADRTIHCRNKEPAQCAGELASYLRKRHKGARIAQIGFQPRMIEALSRKFPFRVVDLDADNIGARQFGITIEGPRATEDAVHWADILLVTGSTLVNGTIGSFLVGKPLIFYGTTIAGPAALMGWMRFCACGH